MVHFLNTAGAYSEIENIIGKAEHQLILISPYIQIAKPLLERLTYVSEKHAVNITLVCRIDRLNRHEYNSLMRINRLDILNSPSLHAKCFYNERCMVITSLNLYRHSHMHNREMGILINRDEEPQVFSDAKSEAEFIIQTASIIKINKLFVRQKQMQSNISNVLTADVGSSLRKSFPTFAKLFTSK